jgi:hypothetical protein
MSRIITLLAVVGFLFLPVAYGPWVIDLINSLRGARVTVTP